MESIRRRIDAAKLAALTAQAISAEPAEHVQNPAENEHVAGDVSGNGAGLNMSTQHAHITELESQLAQRFDAADMATAAAQGFRDGATAPAQPVAAPATRQGWAYAALPAPNYPKSGGFPGTFAEAQMRAFADATHALRASHWQAPAGEAILFEHEDGRYAINPDTTGDPAWHRLGHVELSVIAAPAQSGLTDAYVGAREDLSIWKRRALEAEATVRNFVREANSPTFMGDPASDECHHGDAFQGATP